MLQFAVPDRTLCWFSQKAAFREGVTTVPKNKCWNCIHNLNPHGLNCEFSCTGVTRIVDDGLVVVSCDDYEYAAEQQSGAQSKTL